MERRFRRLLAGAMLTLLAANPLQAADLDQLNRALAGQVLDLTKNHGRERRIWSESLGLWRDMYVYLPPGYEESTHAYPLLLWIHGFGGDEEQFTRQVVRALDNSIVAGAMPPVVVVAPDCSVPSRWKPWSQGSWCINGRQGKWEDYLVRDVIGHAEGHFRVRREREARIIAGWSMGGFGAFSIAFKHPDQFHHVVGIYPNLNICYADKAGHWGTDFHPDNLGRLTNLKWNHWLGRYPRPWRFPVPAGVVFWPAWGRPPEALDRMSQENPYDLLDRLDIRDGQYNMLIAYGGQDEYNVDAQVESFLHKATARGLNIWVRKDAHGHHSSPYVTACMPDVLKALGISLHDRLEWLAKTNNQSNPPLVSVHRD